MTRIIAMWSGPRNISTAMMRSWENRVDTVVWDEPLYACFLDRTGIEHPGREEILARHADEIDYEAVVDRMTAETGTSVFYQKHIAHHLLEDMDRSWMDDVRIEHCFLIRDPREVILSLHQRFPAMELRDTGLPQQVEIFRRRLEATGEVPPVIDARNVLEDPAETLAVLCDRLGLPFQETMLSWPAGSRPSDGAWADWWYDSVRASTGFEPWKEREGDVPAHLEAVHEQCQALYDQLHAHRLVT